MKRGEEKDLFTSLSRSLGWGESSSIAMAKNRNYVIASDDRAARKKAALLGVKLTGTVGILYKAVKKRVITMHKGDEILKEVIKAGFYSPISSLKEIG